MGNMFQCSFVTIKKVIDFVKEYFFPSSQLCYLLKDTRLHFVTSLSLGKEHFANFYIVNELQNINDYLFVHQLYHQLYIKKRNFKAI